MPHEGGLLQATVIFLVAAVITVPLAKRLQLGAVLGYLLAGVLIGPQVLGLVNDAESVARFSELGVVLLLFIIGLELSPRRLWLMRKAVFGVGMAQVLLTGMVLGAVALLGFAQSPAAAAILGLGLALSSTALGLQSLAESRQLTSPHGRLAFAILLFQDIAAIPLIALVPLLAANAPEPGADSALLHSAKVLASIAVVVIGGRYLLRPLFRVVAKTGLAEVSTATALLVVIGTAWLMELAGVSMALGAFLAGLLLADSEYRHELESQIMPFKGLLLGLFFISVGMGANLDLLLRLPLQILGLTLLLLAVKVPLLLFIGRTAGGLDAGQSLRLGVVLGAGGEFAFVVFKLAQGQGLFSAQTYDTLLVIITLSMALTPLLQLLCNRCLAKRPVAAAEVPPALAEIDSDQPQVVIAGMGRVGQVVARILHAQGIRFVALDTAVDTIEMTRSFEHVPVFYGDPTRPEILAAAQVDSARYFVVALDDPQQALLTTQTVRRLYPHVTLLARARNREQAHYLLDAGADAVRETFYSSLELTRRTLTGLGLSAEQAAHRLQQFTQHDEQVLAAQHRVRGDHAQLKQTTEQARLELAELFRQDRR